MDNNNRDVRTVRGGYALVSDEQIVSAIEQVSSEGQRPTVRAVRDRLGCGSNYRIQQALRDWRESRKPTQLQREIRVSDSLLQAITQEVEQARSKSVVEALADLVETKVQLDESSELLGETEQQRDELEQANAELERKHDEQRTVARQRQQRIQQLEEEQRRLHNQVQDLTQQLATTQATQQMQQVQQNERMRELQEQYSTRISELQNQAEQHKYGAEQATQRAVAAEQSAAVNTAKTEAIEGVRIAADETIMKLEKHIEQQRERGEHLQQRLYSSQEKAATVAQEYVSGSAKLQTQLHEEKNKNAELVMLLATEHNRIHKQKG